MRSSAKRILVHGFLGSFWRGFFAAPRASRLIFKDKRIFTLVLVPFLINLVIYSGFFYYGSHFFESILEARFQLFLNWAHSAAPWLPAFAFRVLQWGYHVFVWLVLGLVAALSFTLVSSLISAPFNDALCKKTLAVLGTEASLFPKHSLSTVLWLELKRLIVLGILSILVLVLSLIPFFQIPALVLGCYLVSFEYFGIPVALKSEKLSSVVFFILRRPLLTMGFGAFLLLMMVLPFTSVFYIPMAVLGGAEIFYQETILKQDKHKRT